MNSVPLQRTVVITNPNGLHMRPSLAFVELAGRFESKVTVSLNGQKADGKSILDLFGLLVLPGSELLLEVDGPDAPQAIDALVSLLTNMPPEN